MRLNTVYDFETIFVHETHGNLFFFPCTKNPCPLQG